MTVNDFIATLLLSSLIGASPAAASQSPDPDTSTLQSDGASSASTLRSSLDGPPRPVAPDVIARDSQGRATVRAVRVTTPLYIDGRLDEDVFKTVKPMSGFYQSDPRPGAPATDDTEVWLLFDDTTVYFVARCWQSERTVSTEMRRDGQNIIRGDYVGFVLDTFYDRRNGILINMSPNGGRRDGLVTDERRFNVDWNGIFESATGRFDGGWTAEVAVPFKTLRYRPGRDQVWGFNVQRVQRVKNERTYLMPMTGMGTQATLLRVSLAATVVGVEAPAGAKNLDIKPYIRGDMDVPAPGAPTDGGGGIGVDVKYGITQNLTANVTFNTDFAQVEADEEQINLTRFNLFFPEKREFFLEDAGLFAFGGAGTGPFSGGGGPTPVLFYSRQIGLNDGQAVPIDVGGRVTGRVGSFSVGAVGIRTGDASGVGATGFTALRATRNLFRRSSVGAIFTHRSISQTGVGSNQAYGVDGRFPLSTNLLLDAYWAQTTTNGSSTGAASYRLKLDYDADRYGAQIERLVIGERFNPEVGFVRRLDVRRDFAQVRFSPLTTNHPTIRQYSWTADLDRAETTAGHLETRQVEGQFAVSFHNGDAVGVTYDNSYESVPAPFDIGSAVTIPTGEYHFNNVALRYSFGTQRVMSGTVRAERGTFYGGNKTTLTASQSRGALTNRLSIDPGISFNWIDVPAGQVTTRLVSTRATYTFSPLMFVSALVQYNSSRHALGANVRLRWEYQPGSELFVVYNEQRNTLGRGYPDHESRAVIVKVNRLFRY